MSISLESSSLVILECIVMEISRNGNDVFESTCANCIHDGLLCMAFCPFVTEIQVRSVFIFQTRRTLSLDETLMAYSKWYREYICMSQILFSSCPFSLYYITAKHSSLGGDF